MKRWLLISWTRRGTRKSVGAVAEEFENVGDARDAAMSKWYAGTACFVYDREKHLAQAVTAAWQYGFEPLTDDEAEILRSALRKLAG